jgi:hypothetical protein
MNFLTAPLGSIGLLAVIYTFYILANLSRRYGQVIRMPPYYRGFFIGIALIIVAFLSHLVQDSVIIAPEQAPSLLNNDWFYLVTYYLPLAIAVTLAMTVAWRYWSWMLKEQQE